MTYGNSRAVRTEPPGRIRANRTERAETLVQHRCLDRRPGRGTFVLQPPLSRRRIVAMVLGVPAQSGHMGHHRVRRYRSLQSHSALPGSERARMELHHVRGAPAVPCNGVQFGFAMVQYSADGRNWSYSMPLHHAGGPSARCAPELGSNLVQVEALDAVDDGQGTIRLIGMEGNVSTLLDPNTWIRHSRRGGPRPMRRAAT